MSRSVKVVMLELECEGVGACTVDDTVHTV